MVSLCDVLEWTAHFIEKKGNDWDDEGGCLDDKKNILFAMICFSYFERIILDIIPEEDCIMEQLKC